MINEAKEISNYIYEVSTKLINKFEDDFFNNILPEIKIKKRKDKDIPYVYELMDIYFDIKDKNIIRITNDLYSTIKYNRKNTSVVKFFENIKSSFGILKKYILPYTDTNIKNKNRVFKIDVLSFNLDFSNEAIISPMGKSEVIDIKIFISYDMFFSIIKNKNKNKFQHNHKRELINLLAHELTHLYDFIITGQFEEFETKKKYKKHIEQSKEKNKSYFSYRVLPSEINSFYTGAISSIKHDISSGKIKKDENFVKNVVRRFAKYFSNHTIDLKRYPIEIRKRLLSRLYNDLISD